MTSRSGAPALLERGGDGAKKLRRLLEPESPTLVLPGVSEALGGVLAERAGFKACYLTGAGVANTQFALPDVGLVNQMEMVDQARRVVAATSLPVVVDADAGHGGPLGVMRTVDAFAAAGVAGVQLEDQVSPKRCGHFEGKQLVEPREMAAKIRAAVRARGDHPLVIVARTDAIAVEGFEQALERAHMYQDCGADVLFVEAPRTHDEVERVPASLPDRPLLINIVEGGLTPELPVADLSRMGYRIVLHANMLMRTMMFAGRQALEHLQRQGETVSLHDRMLTWSERQDLVGLEQLDALEDEIRAEVQAVGQ